MKICFDSSFFFPFINVEVENLTKQDMLDILQDEKIEIMRSEIVLFELSAKGTKYVNEGLLAIEDVTEGLNFIYYHPTIQVIPYHYSEIQIFASLLRSNHSDFIDCLILASALYYSDFLLTFDGPLIEKAQSIWRKAISRENKEFKILLWEDFDY